MPAFRPPARNPFMARNGRSNLHNDAYQTNAYAGAGPSGAKTRLTSAFLQQECASLTFDRRGQIVSVCVGAVGETLDVLQPHSLKLLATYPLPTEAKVGVGSLTGGANSATFGGGGYFYLDNHDDAVVPTVDGRVVVLNVSRSAHPVIRLRKIYNLAPTIHKQAIESALPDWHGNLWFVTTAGTVGIAKPSGEGARVVHLVTPKHAPSNAGKPEKIGNSFAIDESGGVFVVSEEALYRFDATANGRPHITWRKRYNHGRRLKPGQVNFGSGTTPTLIHSAHSKHGGLIAILDNADPSMHLDVFPRGRSGSHKAVCKLPIFTSHERSNSDENNLISLGSRLWAENNYGRPGPVRVTNTTPGMEQVRIGAHGCHKVWESNRVRIPSAVSKVSARSGLVYTYTHPFQPSGGPEAWYITAVNARTGHVVWSRFAGAGPDYNNFYSPVTIGPDGTLYVGTVGGLVELRGPLAGRKR